MKDSFILYTKYSEIFEQLSNDDAGRLIKAILLYAKTGECHLDGMLKVIFTPIKQDIDRNNKVYEAVCERNRQNIRKRWDRENTKNTSGKIGIPKNTKNTDNDNDNEYDIREKNIKKRVFTKPTLDEIQNYIDEKGLKVSAKQFYDYFETGDWKDSKGQKVKNWKQKLLTWNKYAKDDPVSNRFHDPNDQYSNIENLYANF